MRATAYTVVHLSPQHITALHSGLEVTAVRFTTGMTTDRATTSHTLHPTTHTLKYKTVPTTPEERNYAPLSVSPGSTNFHWSAERVAAAAEAKEIAGTCTYTHSHVFSRTLTHSDATHTHSRATLTPPSRTLTPLKRTLTCSHATLTPLSHAPPPHSPAPGRRRLRRRPRGCPGRRPGRRPRSLRPSRGVAGAPSTADTAADGRSSSRGPCPEEKESKHPGRKIL